MPQALRHPTLGHVDAYVLFRELAGSDKDTGAFHKYRNHRQLGTSLIFSHHFTPRAQQGEPQIPVSNLEKTNWHCSLAQRRVLGAFQAMPHPQWRRGRSPRLPASSSRIRASGSARRSRTPTDARRKRPATPSMKPSRPACPRAPSRTARNSVPPHPPGRRG